MIRDCFPFQTFLNNEIFVAQIETFLKSESLVSIKYGTGYHFVSIDFHEFEIDGIIRPTKKIC